MIFGEEYNYIEMWILRFLANHIAPISNLSQNLDLRIFHKLWPWLYVRLDARNSILALRYHARKK